MLYISGGKARSLEETKIGLARTIEGWESRGFGFWAVTAKGSDKVIGYCGFMFLEGTPEIELAYGLAKSHWGGGFATEAARACLRYGLEEMKLERIVAVVNPQNIASQRVLEKLGMRYTKDVHHYDADLMYYEISSARVPRLSTRASFQLRTNSKPTLQTFASLVLLHLRLCVNRFFLRKGAKPDIRRKGC